MSDLNNRLFPPAYFPWLVQDVVAARLWLDLKHDAEEVNSANLILMAEGEAAQVAALWLATEARRYRTGGLVPGVAPMASLYEARDLYGAVWIDLRAPVRVSAVRGTRADTQLTNEKSWPPMLTFYNQVVPAAKVQTQQWTRMFRQVGRDVGGEKPVFWNPGRLLIAATSSMLSAPGVEVAVEEYVAGLQKTHGLKAWVKRDVQSSEYVWDLGSGRSSPAKVTRGRQVLPGLAPLDNWGFKTLKIR
jgi:hypothetical protein